MKNYLSNSLRLLVAVVLCAAYHAADAQTAPNVKSTVVVNIDGSVYYAHKVAKGETLYSIARLYETDQRSITGSNPQLRDGGVLKEGSTIKIPADQKELSPRKKSKLFNKHTVNRGETAYSISKRYAISVGTLVEDNPGIDPTSLSVGQVLNIRKSVIGTVDDSTINEGWEQYAESLNSVGAGSGMVYHLVEKGETLYSLSKYFAVPQSRIEAVNDLKDGLKTGSIIRIPVASESGANTVAQGKPAASDTSYQQKPASPVSDRSLESIFRTPVADPSERRGSKVGNQYEIGHTLRIAMMLPLKSGKSPQQNYLEFYQGSLLALEDMKRAGISARLDLYNTERSVYVTEEIVRSDRDFAGSELIIGPVYEECLAPVVKFAERRGIPVVSPLAVAEAIQSPDLFQLSPTPASKYSKLESLFSERNNIVVISSAKNDKEFEKEILPYCLAGCRKLDYAKGVTAAEIERLLSSDKDNVIVVLASEENGVDEVLARLSSIQNNRAARSNSLAPIYVVGSSRWARFRNIDKNLFFKLRVNYVTSYYADRSDPRVLAFDKRYISAFGSQPSLYSYRGYDAVKMFGMAAFTGGFSYESRLGNASSDLLQMLYEFRQQESGGTFINTRWALVSYHTDYTVSVE